MQSLSGPIIENKENINTSKNLLAMAVGARQKEIVDHIVRKFISSDFTVMLFHYDGIMDEWKQFQWCDSALHVSAINQTKWYVQIIKEEGLEISQPALSTANRLSVHYDFTARQEGRIAHRRITNPTGINRCYGNVTGPPCAGSSYFCAKIYALNLTSCNLGILSCTALQSLKRGLLSLLRWATMKCFQFSNRTKKEDRSSTKSPSGRSYYTTSTDREVTRSESEFTSRNVSDTSIDSVGRSGFPSFSQRPNNLRVFSFSELRTATRNFSRSLMIGEGGFGCVYRGTIKDHDDPHIKLEIAVKQLSRKGLQGHKEWLTEVNVLGIVEHPNLVKLVGYCADDDERGMQRLLVYEFMPNRSVEDHLSNRSSETLSWSMRLKIALDAARGLKYLHEDMDFQIIFRDLKTSNILLDEHWNAKLSDFGLARQGPTEGLSHVSTAVVGTLGYAAPEYIQTGRLTAKSDIWSYGVVLYELITGRRPLDRNRPKGEQKLLEWVRPYIADSRRFRLILDPRLQGNYSLKAAQRLSAVANKCLVRHAKSRPKMSEVLEMVKKIVENEETGNPEAPLISCPPKGIASEGGQKKEKTLKRRILDLNVGEGRRFVWQGCTPKLVRTC